MERQEQAGSDADEGPTRVSDAHPLDPQDAQLLVEVVASEIDDRRLAASLEPLATLAIQSLGLSGELRIRLVRDNEMADAHQRHTGIGGTTDVLTFDLSQAPLPTQSPTHPTSGHTSAPLGSARLSYRLDVDLLLCVDEASRQAESRAIPLLHELLLYIIHGTLHCIGYDDHTEADAARMHAREDEILTSIGLGEVYAKDVRHDVEVPIEVPVEVLVEISAESSAPLPRSESQTRRAIP